MAYGISPALPLVYTAPDGPYGLTKTIPEALIQNFKNLVLTNPGERMMDPEFGVGLRKYLFEPNDAGTYLDIETRIRNQVQKYLSFISVERINFFSPTAPEGSVRHGQSAVMDGSFLGIQIRFKIIPIGSIEILNLP